MCGTEATAAVWWMWCRYEAQEKSCRMCFKVSCVGLLCGISTYYRKLHLFFCCFALLWAISKHLRCKPSAHTTIVYAFPDAPTNMVWLGLHQLGQFLFLCLINTLRFWDLPEVWSHWRLKFFFKTALTSLAFTPFTLEMHNRSSCLHTAKKKLVS